MLVTGIGELIGERNSMCGPDDLTCSKVPPHVRIIETPAHTQHGQHHEQAGQHRGKREDPSPNTKAWWTGRLVGNQGCSAQAVPISVTHRVVWDRLVDQVLRAGQATFSDSDQPMQISPRDVQTSCSQCLISIVFAHRCGSQLDLEITNLTLE